MTPCEHPYTTWSFALSAYVCQSCGQVLYQADPDAPDTSDDEALCWACGGTGLEAGTGPEKCPDCDGSGYQPVAAD